MCYYNKDNENNEIIDELREKITILNSNISEEFKAYNELKNDSEEALLIGFKRLSATLTTFVKIIRPVIIP